LIPVFGAAFLQYPRYTLYIKEFLNFRYQSSRLAQVLLLTITATEERPVYTG